MSITVNFDLENERSVYTFSLLDTGEIILRSYQAKDRASAKHRYTTRFWYARSMEGRMIEGKYVELKKVFVPEIVINAVKEEVVNRLRVVRDWEENI